MKICTVEGCGDPVYGKSPNSRYCAFHKAKATKEVRERYERSRKRTQKKPESRGYSTVCRDNDILPPQTNMAWMDKFKPWIESGKSYEEWRRGL